MSVARYITNYFSRYLKNRVLYASNYENTISISVKNAHTDIKVPDFSEYRRDNVKNPNIKTDETDSERKGIFSLAMAVTCVMGLYGTKAEIHRYVLFMAPSAEVLAMAKIEVNLSEVPMGKSATFKWRGRPLFVRHRTPEEIKVSESVPLESLRDPAKDSDRCPNKSFLVVIGVCTHLGCVPVADAGDFGPGGYYCPCHGSHFDAAGRIRKGPAPTNLEIPEHKFLENNLLVVG